MLRAVAFESEIDRVILSVEPPGVDRMPRRKAIARSERLRGRGVAQNSKLGQRRYRKRCLRRRSRCREKRCVMARDEPRIHAARGKSLVLGYSLQERDVGRHACDLVFGKGRSEPP